MLTIHKEGMKWQGGRLVPTPKDEAGVRGHHGLVHPPGPQHLRRSGQAEDPV